MAGPCCRAFSLLAAPAVPAVHRRRVVVARLDRVVALRLLGVRVVARLHRRLGGGIRRGGGGAAMDESPIHGKLLSL